MVDRYCMTAQEYAEQERPDLDFLWAGMIPRLSMVVLEGAPKVGKTFLALQIAKAIAEGSDFGGRPCTQARVLYLILEDEPSWHDRLKKLLKAGYTLPPNLFIPDPFRSDKPFVQHILAPETQRWLKGCLNETDPELVIIDPLREIHSCDEQDSTAMKIMGDALVTTFHGRTMVILHHTKKYEPDPENPRPPNPVLAGRGSSYLSGKASTIWLLWKAHIDDTHGIFLGAPRFDKSFKYDLEQRDPGLWHWQAEQLVPIENLPPDVLVCGLGAPHAAVPNPASHPADPAEPALPGPGVHPPDGEPHPPDYSLLQTPSFNLTPPEPLDTPAHGNHPDPRSDGKWNGRGPGEPGETDYPDSCLTIPPLTSSEPSIASIPEPSASDGS